MEAGDMEPRAARAAIAESQLERGRLKYSYISMTSYHSRRSCGETSGIAVSVKIIAPYNFKASRQAYKKVQM
jgi:hypothetical protein